MRAVLLGSGWSPDQPGGLNRYFRDLVEALPAAGVEAEAVVIGPGRDTPAGVHVAADTDSPLLRRLYAFARAARGPADVVDAHFALYAFIPVVLGRLRHTPLVVHFHGPWADESRSVGNRWLRTGVKRQVERQVYRRANELVTLSAAFKRLLVERYGVQPWHVHVVPPGVRLDVFTPGDRAAARKRLGLPEDAWAAVAVRRLVPRMGIDVLLRAWNRAGLEGSLLLVAGDGPDRGRLEAEAGPSIRFLGQLTDAELLDLYRAADLSVVPSVALEGFGLTALESLACGTPVIVTAVGGLPEAVDGLPGSVVRAGDAAALATALTKARASPSALAGPGACRRHAENFSWTVMAERNRSVYERAVTGERSNPIRVVYVDHCAQLSGGELALLRVLRALHDVDAHVILGEDGPLVQRLTAAGISVEVLPLSPRVRDLRRDAVLSRAQLGLPPLLSVLYVARLRRRLKSLKPDLVHTNSLKAALYGGVAGRLARIPVVWHVRDRIAADYLPPRAVKLVRAMARRIPSGIVANSVHTLQALTGAGDQTASVLALPSPVVMRDPIFEMGPEPMPDEERLLHVGMVGRIAPWKGQHVFLEAFAQAFSHGSERAVIIGAPLFGEEQYERELRALTHKLGIADRVEFAGFREDVAAELARLDVLVHASVLTEPFGQVVAEGLAAGKAVVAAGAGGPTEIISDGENGLLFTPGDSAALADKLRVLAEDPALRSRLGRAGIQKARDFAPARIGAELTAFYRDLLT